MADAKKDSTRVVKGVTPDLKDRTRDVYKPGAHPPPPSPLDAIEKWVKAQLAKNKKKPKP